MCNLELTWRSGLLAGRKLALRAPNIAGRAAPVIVAGLEAIAMAEQQAATYEHAVIRSVREPTASGKAFGAHSSLCERREPDESQADVLDPLLLPTREVDGRWTVDE